MGEKIHREKRERVQAHERAKRRGILVFYDVWTNRARATQCGVILHYTDGFIYNEKKNTVLGWFNNGLPNTMTFSA